MATNEEIHHEGTTRERVLSPVDRRAVLIAIILPK